jgi:hypothetical protein
MPFKWQGSFGGGEGPLQAEGTIETGPRGYADPLRLFPPPLREGLRRNESRGMWVAQNEPAISPTPAVAWERLINEEGYTVPVARTVSY